MTSFSLKLVYLFLVLGATIATPTKSDQPEKGVNVSWSNDKEDKDWVYGNTDAIDTRRILEGHTVPIGKRPYMVYLQLTKESAKAHKSRGWVCGGVIVHASYVLTSAACVEDAEHFYVVAGTPHYVDSLDYKSNECVCKNRRKVIWKCIPKNYKFDFQDSIKWSSNDIAIVKVDIPFKIGQCEEGCPYAPQIICYNNVTRDWEKPGTKGYIMGWGSSKSFREGVYRRQQTKSSENSLLLQETRVVLMDNEQCSKKWSQRFRDIITEYMICTQDLSKSLSEICEAKYVNCTDVESRRHKDKTPEIPEISNHLDLGEHLQDPNDQSGRRSKMGGFCENDHGGPLVVHCKGQDRVIGVISACKIDPKTHSCHGPFLYTSVFKNRQFLSCAINKDVESSCRRVFRSGITHEEWTVNWDNVKEDDVDEKSFLRNDDKNDKENLRQGKKSKAEDVKSEKKKEESDSSSDSNDEDSTRTAKKEDNTDSKKEKANKQGKSKTREHSEKKEKEDKVSSKRSKVDVKGLPKGEVFYESSRDANVNEPEDLV